MSPAEEIQELETAAARIRNAAATPTHLDPDVAVTIAGWLGCVIIDARTEPESAPRIKEMTTALAVARAINRNVS